MGKYKDIWNRDKDGASRPQRSFVRYAIVTFVLTIAFLFLKKDNIVRWVQAGVTIRKQEAQIERYRKENADLDRRIDMMSTNRDTLEKFARENFQFAAPGDDVFVEE